jgi:hypothetical protein
MSLGFSMQAHSDFSIYECAICCGIAEFIFAMATVKYVWSKKTAVTPRNKYDYIGLVLGILTLIQNVAVVLMAL